MLHIKDKLFIDILIDGKPIPTSANAISRIVMAEGNGALVPSLEFVFNDTSEYLSKQLALTDGNSISIVAGRKPDDLKTVTRLYRLFGSRQLITASGPQIHGVGIINAPKYAIESVREAYTGPSTTVLQQVAKNCGLNYNGPINGKLTKDHQTWLNICKSRAMFCMEVSRHGFMDDNSAMSCAVTSLHELRYRNLVDSINVDLDEVKGTFVHNFPRDEPNVYIVRQAQDRSTAGLANSWQNYGSTRINHSLEGSPQVLKSLDVKTKGKFLPINNDIALDVNRSRIDYSPLDCGNVNDNYHKGYYSNIKHLSLFSEKISLLVYDPTDVQLYDPVIYKQANSNINEPVKTSDVYLVVGKTIFIKGGNTYAERIELARMSLNVKGTTTLKAQDPLAEAISAIPNSFINPTVRLYGSNLNLSRQISQLLSPILSSLGNINGLIPTLNVNTFRALGPLGNLSSSLVTSNVTSIASALAMASPSLQNVTNHLTAMATPMLSLNNSLGQLSGSMNGLGVSQVIRTSSLLMPNGVFNNYTVGTLPISQTINLFHTVSNLKTYVDSYKSQIINSVSGGLNNYNMFNGVTSGFQTAALNVIRANTGSWNRMTQNLTDGIPSGTTYPNVYTSAMSGSSSRSLLDNSNYIKDLMINRNDSGDYNWQSESFTPSRSIPLDSMQQFIQDQQTESKTIERLESDIFNPQGVWI